MPTPRLSELEARLLQPPEPGRSSSAELDGLPEPVRRHLSQAIATGTPLATAARLRMRGRIKVGRWLPFRARQILNPHLGFVWAARAAGVITGPSGTWTVSAGWTGSWPAWSPSAASRPVPSSQLNSAARSV